MAKMRLLQGLVQSPWWISGIAALVVLTVGWFVLPSITIENPVLRAFNSAAQVFAVPLALMFACSSVFSFVKESMAYRHRRVLYEKQRGIETINDLSWDDFEKLIGEYFSRHGYAVAGIGGSGADGGVDLRLRKGKKRLVVQCKLWKGKVGVSIVRELLGVVTAQRSDGGIVVTSGAFTRAASAFASENNIGLIGGDELSRYFQSKDKYELPIMSEFDGTPVDRTLYCPECGSEMVERMARKGINAGTPFHGCSNFPRCRGVRNIST